MPSQTFWRNRFAHLTLDYDVDGRAAALVIANDGPWVLDAKFVIEGQSMQLRARPRSGEHRLDLRNLGIRKTQVLNDPDTGENVPDYVISVGVGYGPRR